MNISDINVYRRFGGPYREIDFAFVSCSCRACERAGEAKLCGREMCVLPTLGLRSEKNTPPRARFFGLVIPVLPLKCSFFGIPRCVFDVNSVGWCFFL